MIFSRNWLEVLEQLQKVRMITITPNSSLKYIIKGGLILLVYGK
jgi:hypothetical protein